MVPPSSLKRQQGNCFLPGPLEEQGRLQKSISPLEPQRSSHCFQGRPDEKRSLQFPALSSSGDQFPSSD